MSIRPLPSARRNAWWIYLVGGTLLTVLYVFVAPFKGQGPVMNVLGLSGVLAVVAGIRLHRPRVRGAWLFFVAGLGLFWGGDVVTYSYAQFTGVTASFPSVGDALYVSVYPVLMCGLFVLVRARNKRADGPGLIDSLIMSLGLALISIIVLIAPYVHDHMALLPKVVSIAYPAGDIILLAAGIRLAVDNGKRRPSFYLLIASVVTLLVTDFTYGVFRLDHAYDGQLWMDIGWIYFYLLWGAAALHPSMHTLSDPGVERTPRLSPTRLALLAGATLIAPVLEFLNISTRHDPDLELIIAASIVLFGLVVGRMAGLVRQRETSVIRERLLTIAGGRLVAAGSDAQIAHAGLGAAVELASPPAHALLVRVVDREPRAMAVGADGEAHDWAIPAEVPAHLRGCRDGEPLLLPAWMGSYLHIPAHERSAVVIALGDDGRSEIWLIVAGANDVDLETRAALALLAGQISLALAGASLSEQIHRRASEARFASLVQNSSDLITVLDGDLRIVYQSPSIEPVLGYGAEEVTGRPFAELLHSSEGDRLLRRLRDGSRGRAEPIECRLATKDGGICHFEILHTDLRDDDEVHGIVLNGRDVSERKAFEEQLTHQAFHDTVTHLPNRALFNERVRHAVARSRREGLGIAAIFVDLDDFKTVNDSLGHAAGDRLLLEAARRISASVRAADTAARFGGDEFAILLEDVEGVQAAAETAERILDALAAPLELEHKALTIRASLGISIVEHGSPAGADELVRNADAAMYIAKAEGKGGYRVFEPAMHERVLSRLELLGDLQRALTNREFELHYQPLIRLSDGIVTGVEALLRWRHPERGMITPDGFIPFAEETGLIVPIGRWVLQEGCRQAKALRSRLGGDVLPTIGINLSVKQLFDDDIVRDVIQALVDAELEPSALTLEITESVMMTDTDLAAQRLAALHDLGIRLAMDDFGTGYSSLSYLSRFPVDILKMDRSLLAAGASPVASGVASAVLALGEAFGLEVVAEGIEFAEQFTTLRDLGCETGQGFYFARPMPAAGLLEFLSQRAANDVTAGTPGRPASVPAVLD